MNHRVSFNAFYTFSKTLSSVQLYNSTTQGLAQNYSKLSLDKGAGDTDQRHVFSMSLNFKPDFYSGRESDRTRAYQRLEHLAYHQDAQRTSVHYH